MFVKQHEIFIIYIYYIYDVITIVKLNKKTTHITKWNYVNCREQDGKQKKGKGEDDNYDKIWNRKL